MSSWLLVMSETPALAPFAAGNGTRVTLRVITAPPFISEPVAGRVKTVPSGIAVWTLAPPSCKMSHGSLPTQQAAAAMNLLPSITEPPPTASRKSIFSRLTNSTAGIKVSYRGLGSMPENSNVTRPAKAAFTSSRIPCLTTLPAP